MDNDFMDYIDAVLVVYDHNAGKEICYAPLSKVKEGDRVETEWGHGTAARVVPLRKDDKFYVLANEVFLFHPVLSIITPIKYEVEK